MKPKKTFREKLTEDKKYPRVEPLTGAMAKRHGEGTIVIPSAREIDVLMRLAKKGKLITIPQIRERLATDHNAHMACPIVTSIHARIAACAAGEDEAEGKKRITPYWRTLKKAGELNEKYPGGLEGQAQRLRDEGHQVTQRGKRFFVEGYEENLTPLD